MAVSAGTGYITIEGDFDEFNRQMAARMAVPVTKRIRVDAETLTLKRALTDVSNLDSRLSTTTQSAAKFASSMQKSEAATSGLTRRMGENSRSMGEYSAKTLGGAAATEKLTSATHELARARLAAAATPTPEAPIAFPGATSATRPGPVVSTMTISGLRGGRAPGSLMNPIVTVSLDPDKAGGGGGLLVSQREQRGTTIAGGGGGGGGRGSTLVMPAGGGGGDRNIISQIVWGGGSGGGRVPGTGARIGGGLAGFGSLAAFGGLGPEHLLSTGLAIAGSAAGAGLGGGLLAAGALGRLAVGSGADILATKTTIANTQAIGKAYDNLQTAVDLYGAKSKQAALAQKQLNQTMQEAGPAAQAELKLHKQILGLSDLWKQTSAGAQKQSAQILGQVVTLGTDYAPRVAAAAQRNLSIINTGLRPLFSWLEGPQGIKIFNDLENKFAKELPYAVHAFSQAIEFVLKVIDQASQQSGDFAKTLDKFFTKLNQTPTYKLHDEVAKYIADFRLWKDLIKHLGEDLHLLFKGNVGTGNTIIGTLDQMLIKLGDWERSIHGQQKLHDIFVVHQKEILELLKLIPLLVSGFGGIYLQMAVPMTKIMTAIVSGVVGVSSALEKLGPAGPWIVGLTLIAAKMGYLKTVLSPVTNELKGMLGYLSQITHIGNIKSPFDKTTTMPKVAVMTVAEIMADVLTVKEIIGGGGIGGGGILPLGGKSSTASKVGSTVVKDATAGAETLGGAALVGGGAAAGGEGLLAALGGPAGIAMAAALIAGPPIIAALSGPVSHLLSSVFGGGESQGQKWAKSFAKGVGEVSVKGSTVINPIPAPQQSDLNKLAAKWKDKFDQAWADTHPGKNNPWAKVMDSPQARTELQKATYNLAWIAVQSFQTRFDQGKIKTTPAFIKDAQSYLNQLPKASRNAAAQMILNYAQGLVSKGELPKSALKGIISALEGQWPPFRAYLRQQGLGTVQAVADAMNFRKVSTNMGTALTQMRGQYNIFWGDTKTTNADLASNFNTTYSAMKAAATTETGQMKTQTLADMKTLAGQWKQYLGQMGQDVTFLAATSLPLAEKQLSTFVTDVAQSMKSGTVTTSQGMSLMETTVLNSLKNLHGQDKVKALEDFVTMIQTQIANGNLKAGTGLSIINTTVGSGLKGFSAKDKQQFMSDFTNMLIGNLSSDNTQFGSGLNTIVSNLNKLLRQFNAPPINPIQVETIAVRTNAHPLSASQSPFANIPQPSNFVQPLHKAGGGLMQIGRVGAAGHDAIPMNIGGTPVVVGDGEQVAIMNRHQQAYLNSRLRDVGGLPGVFQRVNKPHYMAGGGIVTASEYGGPGDPTSGVHGYRGDNLYQHPDSYAELNMGTALGGLPYMAPVKVSYHGHTAQLFKRDIGAGGPGIGGHPRAIDLWFQAANALGFNGLDLVNVNGGAGVNVNVSGGGVSGGVWTPIKVPGVKGTGPVATLLRAALGKATDVANAYGQAHMPVTTGVGGGPFFPIAPGPVPAQVQIALQAAQAIAARHPAYGHMGAGWGLPAYDCSSYVSTVMDAAGIWPKWTYNTAAGPINAATDPGPGKWITIGTWGTSGQAAHTMMEIDGHFFESGGGDGGPHVDSGWSQTFDQYRHPHGFAKGGFVTKLGRHLLGRHNPGRGNLGYQPTPSEAMEIQREQPGLLKNYNKLFMARGGLLPGAYTTGKAGTGGKSHTTKKKAPKHHKPIKPPHLPKFNLSGLTADLTAQYGGAPINMGNLDTLDQSIQDYGTWQSHVTGVHQAIGSPITSMTTTDAQGNSTTNVNWGTQPLTARGIPTSWSDLTGAVDPDNPQNGPTMAIYDRLRQIGSDFKQTIGGGMPPFSTDFNTELPMDSSMVGLYNTEVGEAAALLDALNHVWFPHINKTILYATQDVNYLQRGLDDNYYYDNLAANFKYLGLPDVTVGWTAKHLGHGKHAHTVKEKVTEAAGVYIRAKVKELKNLLARITWLRLRKQKFPNEKRDRLNNLTNRYSQARKNLHAAAQKGTLNKSTLRTHLLAGLTSLENTELSKITKPANWQGTSAAWTAQSALDKAGIRNSFVAQRTALEDMLGNQRLKSRLKLGDLEWALNTGERNERTRIEDQFNVKGNAMNDQITHDGQIRKLDKDILTNTYLKPIKSMMDDAQKAHDQAVGSDPTSSYWAKLANYSLTSTSGAPSPVALAIDNANQDIKALNHEIATLLGTVVPPTTPTPGGTNIDQYKLDLSRLDLERQSVGALQTLVLQGAGFTGPVGGRITPLHFAGSYAQGGYVAGPPGQAVMIQAHGGEFIIPEGHHLAGDTHVNISKKDGADKFLANLMSVEVNKVSRQQSRRGIREAKLASTSYYAR